jgi:hypothetical protein
MMRSVVLCGLLAMLQVAPMSSGRLDFSRKVTVAQLAESVGARAPSPGRDRIEIGDGVGRVTFVAGKKVADTGLSMHVPLPPGERYTLEFRIRFPEDFEPGLHGKQLGLSGGKGYDGGRGKLARENGDGWSARFQFDTSKEGRLTNTLYVYHSQMARDYGESLHARKVELSKGVWHTMRMTVTMQSGAEVADGRIQTWCDGEPMYDIGRIRFVTKEEGRNINRVRLELFPGGGGAFPGKDLRIELGDVSWREGE